MYKRQGEGEAVAAAAARGEAVTADTGVTAGAGRSAVVLHDVQRNAHERGVGDLEDVARFEIRHPNEGNDLSPRGDKCSSTEGKSDWGSMSTT